MEILILGVVLLVLGVGATFVYDKFKEKQVAEQKAAEEARARRAALLASKPVVNPKTIPAKPKPGPFTKAAATQVKKTVRKTIKPGSIKAGPYKPNDPPVEVEYVNELFDDVSINSQITVQELIAKIERMKKR